MGQLLKHLHFKLRNALCAYIYVCIHSKLKIDHPKFPENVPHMQQTTSAGSIFTFTFHKRFNSFKLGIFFYPLILEKLTFFKKILS